MEGWNCTCAMPQCQQDDESVDEQQSDQTASEHDAQHSGVN